MSKALISMLALAIALAGCASGPPQPGLSCGLLQTATLKYDPLLGMIWHEDAVVVLRWCGMHDDADRVERMLERVKSQGDKA